MKGHFLCCITFIVIVNCCFAQLTWQKRYKAISSSTNGADNIYETSDGGYIIAGSTREGGFGGYDILLFKLDSVGTFSWCKSYGSDSTDFASDIKQTYDGGYIICGVTYGFGALGREALVMKIDSLGNVQWSKIYEDTANTSGAEYVIQTSDSHYVFCGDIGV
jgi:hypothetical protein